MPKEFDLKAIYDKIDNWEELAELEREEDEEIDEDEEY